MDDTRGLDFFLGRLDTFREHYDDGTKLEHETEVEAVARRLWDAEWNVGKPGHALPTFLLREIARTATRLAEEIERKKEREWERLSAAESAEHRG